MQLTSLLDDPVIAFSGIILWPFLLDKRLVEREVVPDTILPPVVGSSVVKKAVGNPLVNLGQCQAFVWRAKNGHSYKRGIAVWWFLAVINDGSCTVCRLVLEHLLFPFIVHFTNFRLFLFSLPLSLFFSRVLVLVGFPDRGGIHQGAARVGCQLVRLAINHAT